ncbi:MAG: hypothetical protein L0H10_05980 [Comamonas sp.]|uniref:hypothetical protein n=1 Tax=Comamonas sp. TaxID=34028 RepID=UPI002647664B|nr:hypothetical protein [Comamonas sp.]MDN5503354.1 hypothetical protein [Comamonas sp.]MDN5536852.1 hypothetical protein [Comamonas sp.]
MKIFEQRRKAADFQIEFRINLLRHWCLNGIPWQLAEDGTPIRDKDGELILDFTPKNLFEFSKWTAAKHSPGNRKSAFAFKIDDTDFSVQLSELISISRTTLSQPYRTDQKATIDLQLAAIARKRGIQLDTSRKKSIIETLKAEKEFLEKVVKSQESETRAARIEAREARVEMERHRRTAANNEAELKRIIFEQEKKLASMARDFAKIAPLKLKGRNND